MLKKQTIIIAVLSILFVILTVGYFAVVKPIVEAEAPESETEAETKLDGEDDAMGIDKVLVYPQIDTKKIQSITVSNDHGTYTVYRDSTSDDLPQIEGFEGVAFHEENMSALFTCLGYPSAMYRVTYPESLEEYGLVTYTDREGNVKEPARFEMVTKNNDRYTGRVGEKIVTGNGYYFLYDGRPDVVYVIGAEIAEALLSPVEKLVAPMIVNTMTPNDYFLVHDYMLMKGEEVIVHLDYIEEEDRRDTEFVTKTYEMLYPQNLTPSAEAVAKAMLGLYTSVDNDTLEVVKLGIKEEDLEKYNLVDNCYSLYYEYDGFENFLLISPRNADGSFYCASPLMRQIVKGTAEVFDFVTWDLFDWVEAPFFQMKISFVKDITVESGDFSVTYDLAVTDAGYNSSGVHMGYDISVTERGTGKEIDVDNFKQFYKTLLYASYEGECGLTQKEMEMYQGMGDGEAQLILTVHTAAGRELRYRFFRYSERRSYVELNGEGEFYTLYSMVEKILADAKRVQSGEDINSTGKY